MCNITIRLLDNEVLDSRTDTTSVDRNFYMIGKTTPHHYQVDWNGIFYGLEHSFDDVEWIRPTAGRFLSMINFPPEWLGNN